MATTTSKPSKVGNNFYRTSVTTNTDGSLSATTFRTSDGKGTNPVAVSKVNTTKDGVSTRTFESGATAAEKAAFSNPSSPERKAYSQQVQSQNPYGSNASTEQKKQVYNASQSPNKATGETNTGDNQGSQLAERDIGTQQKGTRDKFRTDLVYPTTLKLTHQDVIKFNMIKYRPRSLNTGGDLNPIGDRPGGDIIGTVVLPIPAGISDTNSANWGSDELDPFKALGVDIAQTSIVQGIGAGVNKLGDAATAISDNSGDAGSALANKFVEAATGTQNILSRTKGTVVNPNMELLFLGPSLRPFTFNFKLSSRSKEESVMVRDIIRFFKQGMSPIRTEANLFLKAPHTFQIKYLHKNGDHKFLNKFKECALQSFSVQYTPEGQYATFHDGAMVSYQITMQFQELEPVFNDDYGLQDGEIGF
jgi:hypothetical protein